MRWSLTRFCKESNEKNWQLLSYNNDQVIRMRQIQIPVTVVFRKILNTRKDLRDSNLDFFTIDHGYFHLK